MSQLKTDHGSGNCDLDDLGSQLKEGFAQPAEDNQK
jgi:hypothetical protein